MNPCIELSAGNLLERNERCADFKSCADSLCPTRDVDRSFVQRVHKASAAIPDHLVLIGYPTDSRSQACVPVTFM